MVVEFQNQTVVLLFAKYPTAGKVMTRLCPPLSPADAARVQRSCMRHIWRELIAGDWCVPVMVGTPDDALADFAAIFELPESRLVCWPQGDGDLGLRLERASAKAFDLGASDVVFLGVDSPTQNWEALCDTRARLASADLAIGPCADGGYYFLAMKRHVPELFRGIDWGTSSVFDQTCAIAKDIGLNVWRFELGYDIDRTEDLRRALGDLDSDSELARTIRDVLVAENIENTKDSI